MVRRWFADVLQLGGKYGGVAGIIAVGVTAFMLLCWGGYVVVASVSGSIRGISDPVERGMAYIAVAILAHAWVGRIEQNVRVHAGSKGDPLVVDKVRSAE